MKNFSLKLLITFLAACSVLHASAIVRTVSNNPLNAGQYSTLSAAYTASSAGDTIYLQGSVTTYGDLDIKKRITLIGAGYIDSTINLWSTVGTLTIDSSSSGTKILGLIFTTLNNSNYYSTDSVYIGRCCCTYQLSFVGNYWIIENCILGTGTSISLNNSYTTFNCIIRNNFINTIGGRSNNSGVIIDHNIIEGQLVSISYAYITNNVFYGSSFLFNTYYGSPTVTNCFFENNLSLTPSILSLPPTSNLGTGNLSVAFPVYQFNNTLTTAQSYPTLLGYDWHLLPTSIGHNAATDGTDIGMYGGVSPMPNFTGATTIPQMTLMHINNTTVALDSNIHVHIKARKQN